MDALLTTGESTKDLLPDEYAARYLRIMDKNDQLVSFDWNDIQRDYFDKHTVRDLILKPRQIGFTTLVQGEFYRLETTETTRTLTLTDTDDNTQKLRRMADRFHDNIPDTIRQKRKYANASVTTYAALGSEAMIATAGNKQVGRAGSYRFIHLSEAAFYPDLQSILASALQGGRPQWVVIESTPNGAQGKFHEMCMEALRGDGIWTLHFYTWFNFAEYQLPLIENEVLEYTSEETTLIEKHGLSPQQIKWRRYKIAELGSWSQFQQEYAEDVNHCFLSSGAQVFGDFTVYTPEPDAKPIAGHECVAGLDTGQDNDYSALSIIDPETNKEVFIDHWRHMPWSEIRTNVLNACAYWNVGKLYVERNAASATIEALDADAYERKMPISISGVTTTLKRKGEMVIHLRTALQEDGLELLDVAWASAEMRAVQTKQTEQGVWTYTSPRDDNGHGDGVIARMLAVRASLNRIAEFT